MTNAEAERANAQDCADIYQRLAVLSKAVDEMCIIVGLLQDKQERLNQLVVRDPEGKYEEMQT